MQYLGWPVGSQFKLPLGDDEIIVETPGVESFVALLALETRNMISRQEMAQQFGEDPQGTAASLAASFNRDLCNRVVVRPSGFDYGQLSGPEWAYLRPILRKLAGVDGTVAAPTADELWSAISVGSSYERRMGPVRLKATVPSASESDRLRGLRPSLFDDPDEVETKWNDYVEGLLNATDAKLFDGNDEHLGAWRKWSAPRLAAVYDTLLAVTGLTASQFRAEAHLQPLDPAESVDSSPAGDGATDDDYAESDLGDDAGRSDGTEAEPDDGSGDASAEAGLGGSAELGLEAER